jgi:hypothetical protein
MKKRNKYEILAFISEGRPRIMEVNSHVKEVKLDFNFDDNFEYSHKPYSIVLKPTDKVFYAVDCINGTCTDGYIDISNDLYALIRDNKKEITGVKPCDGWQDQERIGNHKCLAKVNYKITAIFDDE